MAQSDAFGKERPKRGSPHCLGRCHFPELGLPSKENGPGILQPGPSSQHRTPRTVQPFHPTKRPPDCQPWAGANGGQRWQGNVPNQPHRNPIPSSRHRPEASPQRPPAPPRALEELRKSAQKLGLTNRSESPGKGQEARPLLQDLSYGKGGRHPNLRPPLGARQPRSGRSLPHHQPGPDLADHPRYGSHGHL